MTTPNPVKEAAADLLEAVRQLDTLEGDVRKALMEADRGLFDLSPTAWARWQNNTRQGRDGIRLLAEAISTLFQTAKTLEREEWDETEARR